MKITAISNNPDLQKYGYKFHKCVDRQYMPKRLINLIECASNYYDRYIFDIFCYKYINIIKFDAVILLAPTYSSRDEIKITHTMLPFSMAAESFEIPIIIFNGKVFNPYFYYCYYKDIKPRLDSSNSFHQVIKELNLNKDSSLLLVHLDDKDNPENLELARQTIFYFRVNYEDR